MTGKPRIVILSGSGAPAIAAANRYHVRLGGRFEIHVVEERNLTLARVITTLRRRWRKAGLEAVLDLLFLRLALHILGDSSHAPMRSYVPKMHCRDINSPAVLSFLQSQQADWLITNGCSIAGEALLNCAPSRRLNVHNGITPRYRGTGNFWAIREGNPALVGVTVHRLDSGIDTGDRISVGAINIRDPRCSSLAGMDIAAFEEGAERVSDYILEGRQGVPAEFSRLPDGYYSYPGLSDWLVANRNLKRWRMTGAKAEDTWRASFNDYAKDESKDAFQRMHWGQSDSVDARDALVTGLLKDRLVPGAQLLDIGGGDGRLALHLPGLGSYVCADYTHAFLRHLPNNGISSGVQCDARQLPFAAGSFDAAVAVGLFQHIAEARRVADEIRSAMRPDGLIVINTLRQFTVPELLAILAGSLFAPERLRLAWAILRRDYFSGLTIDGTMVARRYSRRELLDLFGKAREVEVRYDGIGGSALFAREITLVLKCQ